MIGGERRVNVGKKQKKARNDTMVEKLHTPEGAAKILGLSPRTVTNYLQKGIIKGIKTGTKWRIPESDLQGYIDRLKAERDGKPE